MFCDGLEPIGRPRHNSCEVHDKRTSSVPKRDRVDMTATGHSGTIIDAEVVSDAPPASVALVPLAATRAGPAEDAADPARSELCHATDRDRRPGAANPRHAPGILRGRAGRLRPAHQRAPQRDAADPANHLRSDQRGGLSGDGCASLAGWMPGEATSGEAAAGAEGGAAAGAARLGMIEQHGFGNGRGRCRPATDCRRLQRRRGRLGFELPVRHGWRLSLHAGRAPLRTPATARRRVRSEMPDRKSTSESRVSSRKVEVPNFGHSKNSAAAAPNTMNDSR